MTAVNLQHVLTQDLEHIYAPVTKDIPEMEKHVQVRNTFLYEQIFFLKSFGPISKDSYFSTFIYQII